MKVLLQRLNDLKEEEKKIKEERVVVEGEIYDLVQSQINDDKTLTVYADEFKLTVKPNYAVKVDQDFAKKYPDVFSVKYSLTYSQYKKIQVRSELDEHLEIKILKPTFSCELLGE